MRSATRALQSDLNEASVTLESVRDQALKDLLSAHRMYEHQPDKSSTKVDVKLDDPETEQKKQSSQFVEQVSYGKYSQDSDDEPTQGEIALDAYTLDALQILNEKSENAIATEPITSRNDKEQLAL